MKRELTQEVYLTITRIDPKESDEILVLRFEFHSDVTF